MADIAGKEYFSTLDDLADQGKDTQRLLNFERFGLLDEDTQAAVDSERKAGRIPDPMQPITQDEFDNLKMIYGALTILSPNQTQATDMDYEHNRVFENAKKDLKNMVDSNEREVYCDHLTIKRDKRGSLRITRRTNND